ncbi:MAG: ABC transporter permease [Caldilineaceae bacterium]
MLAKSLSNLRHWIRKNSDIAALPFILVAVVVFMTVATSGRFLSPINLNALASQLPELGLLSLAMVVVILTAGINLSIISSANLVSVIMALIMTTFVAEESSTGTVLMVVLIAFVAGVAVALALGYFNGFLIAYLGLPAMLATLGTMLFYEGVTLAITKGFVISGLPDMYTGLSSANMLGVPLPLVILALAIAVVALILDRTPFGKHLFLIGSSETATKFSAVDTSKVLVKAYVLSGALCGMAGMVMLSRFNSANARSGSSLLLLTILIAVLGGTDPNGGFGKITGVVLSLLTLQFITSGLNLLGVTQFVTLALWGILLILVIAYRHYMTRERRSA